MTLKVTAAIEKQIKAAHDSGLSAPKLCQQFHLSPKTIARLRQKWREAAKADDITPLARETKKIIAITPRNMTVTEAKQQIVREMELQIADTCMAKAKEIVDSLDISKLGEDKKAVTLGILIDKSRLIRGESTQNVAKQEIQFVAVKMLDELEKSKKRQEASPIVDIQADEKSDVENDSK